MANNINYVFFGSPEFAAIILEKLMNAGFAPLVVVTNPDRPVGRKKTVTPPSVKLKIQSYKLQIPVLQPEKLNSSLATDLLSLKPNLFIVAAYGKIIPEEILNIPKFGSIGVHPSLLPKYRGSSPIQSAILKGEKETGVSLYLMDKEMDHGPTLATNHWPIEDRNNYESLMKALANLGARMIIDLLPKIKDGLNPLPQNHDLATFTKKIKTSDAYIEPADLERAQTKGGEIAVSIERKIRALNPEPGTWTLRRSSGQAQKGEKRMKILEAELTLENKLRLKKIQLEGKKPTSA